MSNLFKCQFGSHIYGTNLPTSDLDYKAIFVPSSSEILLQRVQNSKTENTKPEGVEKNRPEDVDFESFSLQKFLDLACQGQTVAMDMLFVPKEFTLESSPIWTELQANKNKLLHKGTSAFVGYTRSQAAKYGVKGFRVAALRDTLEALSRFSVVGTVPLYSIEPQLREFVAGLSNNHVKIVREIGAQNLPQDFLEVCNRKIPLHASVHYAQDVLSKIFENYGTRARLAEKNEGIDWKALMHAVRVAHEATELLTTGTITFPRPEKDLLLQIRKAELPYQEVAQIIEDGLLKVEEAKRQSTLPDSPDRRWVDDFVTEVYYRTIESHYYDEVEQLIVGFFKKEPYKASLWMSTPNPLLGNYAPNVFNDDRTLLKVIRSLLKENIIGGLNSG